MLQGMRKNRQNEERIMCIDIQNMFISLRWAEHYETQRRKKPNYLRNVVKKKDIV